MRNKKKELIQSLIEIDIIKFGEFNLRSGKSSSVYIDLRAIISYPKLLREVSYALWSKVKNLQMTLICGVPYTALPIATCIALDQNLGMVVCRKEPKEYGTKKQVEGVFKKGQNCLIVEDVITTGGSVMKTISVLEQQGLQVTDVVVLVDRQEGAKESIEGKGYRLHSVFTLSDLYQTD